MPYRMRRNSKQVTPASGGLVADMVRQFADRYAFLRELVQNAIDAGASQVSVTVSYDGREQAAVSVQDDGSGMTREIIEGPLLTLFSSAKENDASKIGKYGVGFVSVFAIQPQEVIVETWSATGSFTVRLWADHRYQLELGEERVGSGTIVTLLLTADAEAFEGHVRDCRGALLRWCRHAAVPITLVVDAGAGSRSERLDTPLAVPGMARLETRSGARHIVVSVSTGEADPSWHGAAGSSSFAGFYCRGLTLAEMEWAIEPGLENIRFKVDSPRLQHTLSRDNVRRDEAFGRVLDRVRELVSGALRDRLLAELMTAASAAAEGESLQPYSSALSSALAAPFGLEARDLPVPLCHAVPDQGKLCRADQLVHDRRVLWSAEPDVLTQAAAASGLAVMRGELASAQALGGRLGCPAVQPAEIFVACQPLPAAELQRSDLQLCEHTLAALRVAGANLRAIGLARLLPAGIARAAVAADPDCALALLRQEGTHSWWRRWRDAALLLVSAHAAVVRARKLAERDSFAAGQLLARYLLVEERGEISARQNDALLAHAMRHAGAGTPREAG